MSLMSVSAAVNSMELSVLCLLMMALVFVPLHSAHGALMVKPGVCPRLIIPFADRRPCPRQCTSDRDCDGILKCCFNGCGRTCVVPEKVPVEKPGVCPKRIIEFVDRSPCPMQCNSDSDCDGILKCCFSSCGRICMKPVEVVTKPKPGLCPRPNRFGTCINSCSSDNDCDKDLKCCSNGCGRICMKPVRVPVEKPGVCPKHIIEFVDRRPCPMQCNSDSDCDGILKCCFNGCGRMCVAPEKVVSEPKPGLCPRPNRFGMCVSSCSSDNDCEKDLKCCSNGCGRICMKPVRVPVEKPGVCPKRIIPFVDRRLCPMQCNSDNDCDGIMKCCFGGCGRTCVEPEKETYPGSCPQLRNCDECTVDRQCDHYLKCCHNRCGRRTCMEPVAGLCPRLHFMECEDECSEDSQCEKPLKCCFNHCERRRTCMKPEVVSEPKPGLCPRPNRFRTCVKSCSSDNNCEKDLKCCSNGCGRICMKPVREPKPGTCPRPNLHLPVIPCGDDCLDDYQCPRNLKCCNSGCGKKCMKPLPWSG